MKRVDNATSTQGGFVATGDSTVSSKVINNIVPSAGSINVGDYVSLSAGFPTNIGRFRVEAKTPTSITVDVVASSSIVGLTINSLTEMFTDGVIDAVSRTVLNAIDQNLLQEEIVNAILDDGGSLDGTNKKQLSNAVFLRNAGAVVNGSSTFQDTVTFNNIIVRGNQKLIKGEQVFDETDLTTILDPWYKITLDANSFNSFRYFPSDDLTKFRIVRINIDGGTTGQEITIMNDTHLNAFTSGKRTSLVLQSRIDLGAGNKFQRDLFMNDRDTIVLRKHYPSTLPIGNQLRLGRYPGEGNTAYQWNMVGGTLALPAVGAWT